MIEGGGWLLPEAELLTPSSKEMDKPHSAIFTPPLLPQSVLNIRGDTSGHLISLGSAI